MVNKKAFTLAEVLITLGIIGIVAAMTIPTLTQKYREKAVISKLQKANSVLSQIYTYAQNDNGLFMFNETPSSAQLNEFFSTYWKPYLRISTECSTYQSCGYSKNNPFAWLSGTGSDWLLVYSGRKPFITQDGMVYVLYAWVYLSQGATYQHVIFVDVNGALAPNMLGKDVFVFKYENGKTVFPYGYNMSDADVNKYCNPNNNIYMQGFTCAEKMRRNGWKLPSDYPVKL